MPSFGEKLRRTRESHNTTLEEVALTTKIRLSYLEALERNDFAALPGRAFGKFYIRAYGEVLGFDPQTLISEYDEERSGADSAGPVEAAVEEPKNAWQEALRSAREDARRRRRDAPERHGTPPAADDTQGTSTSTPEAEPEVKQEDGPAREPSPWTNASRARTPSWKAMLFGGFAILVLAVLIGRLGTGGEEAQAPAATIPPPSFPKAPLELVTRTDEAPPAPEEPPLATQATSARDSDSSYRNPPLAAGRLRVPEFGVGRRLTQRRLEGRGDRFEEGGVVWFQTLVLGGERGQHIRHVWLFEGNPVQTIELELGGNRWRTQSSKTLWGVGDWAVEARDTAGQALARATFACMSGGR